MSNSCFLQVVFIQRSINLTTKKCNCKVHAIHISAGYLINFSFCQIKNDTIIMHKIRTISVESFHVRTLPSFLLFLCQIWIAFYFNPNLFSKCFSFSFAIRTHLFQIKSMAICIQNMQNWLVSKQTMYKMTLTLEHNKIMKIAEHCSIVNFCHIILMVLIHFSFSYFSLRLICTGYIQYTYLYSYVYITHKNL